MADQDYFQKEHEKRKKRIINQYKEGWTQEKHLLELYKWAKADERTDKAWTPPVLEHKISEQILDHKIALQIIYGLEKDKISEKAVEAYYNQQPEIQRGIDEKIKQIMDWKAEDYFIDAREPEYDGPDIDER